MKFSGGRRVSTAGRRLWATLLIALAIACGVFAMYGGDSDDNINDPTVSAEEILEQSSDIAKVEVLVAALHPTHRIIHIVDSHSLSRDRFFKAVDTVFGADRFSQKQIHDWYQTYADRVERFQAAQKRVLHWLVDHHGLRVVFMEGVSAKDLPEVRRRASFFREVAARRALWRRELASISQQIQECEAVGRDASAILKRQCQLEDMRDYDQNFGAVGDLLVDRPFVQVRAAEDAQAFADFKRVKLGRAMRSPFFRARDAAIVQNLLSGGPCSVIVLGSAHDLSREVEEQGRGRCEYIRVTTTDFPPPLEAMIAPDGIISP